MYMSPVYEKECDNLECRECTSVELLKSFGIAGDGLMDGQTNRK